MKITNFQAKRIFNFLLGKISREKGCKFPCKLCFEHYVVHKKDNSMMNMYDAGLKYGNNNEFLEIYAFDEDKREKLVLTIASKYTPCEFCNVQYKLLLAKMMKMSKKGYGLFYANRWGNHVPSNIFIKAHATIEEILLQMDMNMFKVHKALI